MKNAIVIGSGIAGLASAIRLQNKGYQTTVLEKNNYTGGKLTEIQLGNFRFDAGPSLFTLPELIEELFAISNKNISDNFNYEKCEISCNYFFEDDTLLKFYADKQRLKEEIETKLSVDFSLLEKYLNRSNYKYEATKAIFLEKSLHKVNSYFSKEIIPCLKAIPKLDLFETLNETNTKNLNHPKLIQIFNRYATYNGSSPYLASGILSLIPHLELNQGSFFPKDGMHSISKALTKLALDLGVKFILNTQVNELVQKNGKIEIVKSNQGDFKGDIVICNADIKTAYNSFLKNYKQPEKILNQERSSSGIIFYWGINRTFENLDLHNILFSTNYKEEFEHIFTYKTVYSDPTIYINVTSKKSASDAPNGCENWFVMINVPSNENHNWEEIRKQARQSIIQKINKILKVNIENHIIEEDYLDPTRIELRTSSAGGALYGSSSNSRNAAFFRHPNFSTIPNLFFVGGSVHPGGGIPLCLNSAKIACDLIKNA
jgi:phytoene desaturase